MNIETKYGLGDKVWKIHRLMPKVWVPCTFCEGTPKETFGADTKITGADGSQRSCPECMGRGGQNGREASEWRIEKILVVGYVEFRIYTDKRRESYMEDGRGGQVHYVDTLYPTKKEAQAECDRRNKE